MNTWKVEDFITFMYQIVADADFETQPEEIAMVKDKASLLMVKYFSNKNYSYAASLEKIKATNGVCFMCCDDVFKTLTPKFDFSKELKLDIIKDLESIASSDNSVSPSEVATIKIIKQHLQTVTMPLSW